MPAATPLSRNENGRAEELRGRLQPGRETGVSEIRQRAVQAGKELIHVMILRR